MTLKFSVSHASTAICFFVLAIGLAGTPLLPLVPVLHELMSVVARAE